MVSIYLLPGTRRIAGILQMGAEVILTDRHPMPLVGRGRAYSLYRCFCAVADRGAIEGRIEDHSIFVR